MPSLHIAAGLSLKVSSVWSSFHVYGPSASRGYCKPSSGLYMYGVSNMVVMAWAFWSTTIALLVLEEYGFQ
ncbi:MAG: hypothetical protein WBD62_20365, partial [Anaerolineales bacterium]